jgi:hypothetical protein
MLKSEKEHLICSVCKHEVLKTDDFCPHCGDIFDANIACVHHHNVPAEGVCIICAEPLCAECGGWVRGLYLCRKHLGYEIVEGMVRIFGVGDETQAQVANSRLEQAGFHPLVFSHKASPISLGGTDDMIFNEIKIMVPCQEVAQAEKVLRELGILHT